MEDRFDFTQSTEPAAVIDPGAVIKLQVPDLGETSGPSGAQSAAPGRDSGLVIEMEDGQNRFTASDDLWL